MAANTVRIEIDDRTKRLSFDEALTTGSTYAVEVAGGAAACGSRSVLVISTQYGDELAYCELQYGKGTLSLDTQAVADALLDVPFGATFAWHALLRSLDEGAEQNAAVGDVQVVAAPYPTPNKDAAQVAFVGPPGKKGEKGEKGDPANITMMRTADGEWHEVRLEINGQDGDGRREYAVAVDQQPHDGNGGFDAAVNASGQTTARKLSERFAEVANVLDFGAWGEGDLYRNVADDGTVTYDGQPNAARLAATGTAHHDDTDAIQAAINHVASHGGGAVYFPCLDNLFRYYRIDKEPYLYYDPETSEGYVPDPEHPKTEQELAELWLLKAQLYIPAKSNISLVGEGRPVSLQHYHVPYENNTYGFIRGSYDIPGYGNVFRTTWACYNVVLRSSVSVDEKVGYEERPWSVIAAPEGEKLPELRIRSSCEMVSMMNIEVRVHFDHYSDTPKLYPTMGAVNLMNVRRMHVENCFLGLDNAIGSKHSSKWLQHSPTTTVGLFGAIEDCAEHKIEQLTVQGFKFGVVLPEMVNANFIHISNCEYALCFLDATHLSVINHLSTHHNRRCICALPIPRPVQELDQNGVPKQTLKYPSPFGCEIKYDAWTPRSGNSPDGELYVLRSLTYKPQVNVVIQAHDYEDGHFSIPPVSWMRWGIWDPQDRMYGSVFYHQGFPGDKNARRIQVNLGKADFVDRDGNFVDASPDRAAKVMASTDHCWYDHRDGGEEASLFRAAAYTDYAQEGDNIGIEADVKSWMEDDWADEPPDFIYPKPGYDADTVDFSDASTFTFVEEATYFMSPTLPPCPCIDGVKYTAPNYGSYYPVLGASHMAKIQATDLGALADLAKALAQVGDRAAQAPVRAEIVMIGNGMCKNVTDGALRLLGGTAAGTGAAFYLFGNDAGYAGQFSLSTGAGEQSARAQLVGNGRTLMWNGDAVKGEGFAAAALPSTSAEVTDLSGTITYSETQVLYSYSPTRNGWFVFEGKVPSGAVIQCRVLRDGTTPESLIYMAMLPGRGGDPLPYSGISVPCPAGSRLETAITGATVPENGIRFCRFVPCGAE